MSPIIKVEKEIAKEVDDVAALLVGLVGDIRAKKSAAAIAAENIPALLKALDGVDEIPKEAAENRRVVLATLGYRTGELADAILGQPKPKQS